MKAQLFGVLASIVFIFFFALIFRSDPTPRRVPTIKYIPVPAECPSVEKPRTPVDQNDRFRVVPLNFINVNFKNRSYGQYKLPTGKPIDLTLAGGDYEYNFKGGDLGWFHLRDIFFADVTGDDTPEAIVFLWHIQCGVSCDGGSGLFYVYRKQGDRLEEIWRYETGSNDTSCGLKAATIMNTQIVLQMFGHCRQNDFEVYGSPKSQTADQTILSFQFNGKRFVKVGTQFISSPPANVENYEPQISIIQ